MNSPSDSAPLLTSVICQPQSYNLSAPTTTAPTSSLSSNKDAKGKEKEVEYTKSEDKSVSVTQRTGLFRIDKDLENADWTVCEEIASTSERLVNKQEWNYYAWLAWKKFWRLRTVEEGRMLWKEMVEDPERYVGVVVAAWEGLHPDERHPFSTILLHLANGALHRDNDPVRCSEAFRLKMLLHKRVGYIQPVSAMGSYGYMNLHCNLWQHQLPMEALQYLEDVVTKYARSLSWSEIAEYYNSLGMGYRFKGDTEISRRWHKKALKAIKGKSKTLVTPIFEARLRSAYARTLLLCEDRKKEALRNAQLAKDLIDHQIKERGAHFREETMHYVYLTMMAAHVMDWQDEDKDWFIKDKDKRKRFEEMATIAMAGIEMVYGIDGPVVPKYRNEIEAVRINPIPLPP